MPDLSHLEAEIERVANTDLVRDGNEPATRGIAVVPVIKALGWDTLSPEEVSREYPVRGGKVDYCLRGRMGNLVLIEVKRTGTDLGGHQEQLLRYAFDEGVRLAALTDGLVWWLYLPMAEGSWEQRRFFSTNFRAQKSADAASAIHRFLNREDVISGAALKEARQEFESQRRDRLVRGALQEAWRQVLGDPQGLLRDLLAETVNEISGHVPDRETIAEFLQELSRREGKEGTSPVPQVRSKNHGLRSKSERSFPNKVKKRKATNRMSAWIQDGHLLVKFADGGMDKWKLPDRSDKVAIRRVRDAAVVFAHDHGATEGQIAAVKKALANEKYYLR